MTTRLLDRFRRALTTHRETLQAWLREGATAYALPLPASGDGSFDEADLPALEEIDRALERIEDGSFGHCTLCDGDVEPERLALDFTTCVCLDHYSEPEVRALERDLELAAHVQRHLYPAGVPALPRVEVAVHARPARIVSGDYYDFFPFAGDAQGVALGDVMGKGLSASMLMANLQASLRILGPEHRTLDALATRLNALFRFNLRLTHFVSLVLLAIDPEGDRLTYCNAGHHPPLLHKAATGTVRTLAPTGPAIGLVPEPTFGTETIAFAVGDLLVLYTDGLVEARSPDGEEFGEARLTRYLQRHHAESAEAFLGGLSRALERFTDGALHDDLSIVVVKRL